MKKDSKITFEEKLIIRKNKAKTEFIAKLACIALVFCMVALYFFAPVSQVSNFKLEGNIYFTSSDILEIAHLNKKTSLYSINTKEVEELLTSHPLIEKSKVKCDFFGLKIKIEEIAPLCNYDGKIYLSNGEVVTEEMKNNELYGSFLVSNLDKTYRADFNPTEIRNKQLEHFNSIWIHASEKAKQKIAFFDIEDEYWDCVYLYSGNENYYYRIKFFDDFDSDITTFTELFSEQHIDDIFKAFDSFMNKEECKLFSKVSVDSDLLDKDFYSIIVRYNQNDYTYSLDMDTSSSEKNS